jgi:hypothetical protein
VNGGSRQGSKPWRGQTQEITKKIIGMR